MRDSVTESSAQLRWLAMRKRVFAVQRRQVHYAGRVQGVGFRYSVQRLASRYAVAGYVRNLADGRVQLVAEGDPAELTEFLDEISRAMSGYIRKANVERLPATGEFPDFSIRF